MESMPEEQECRKDPLRIGSPLWRMIMEMGMIWDQGGLK